MKSKIYFGVLLYGLQPQLERGRICMDQNFNFGGVGENARNSKGLAIASIALGAAGIIAAAAFSWIAWGVGALVGLICGIVGVVLGVIARKQNPGNSTAATLGVILSLIAVIVGAICLASCAACWCNDPYRRLANELYHYFG